MVLPVLGADLGRGNVFSVAGAIAIAAAVALMTQRARPGSRLRFTGAALLVGSAVLIGTVPVESMSLLIAAVLGVAVGLLVGARRPMLLELIGAAAVMVVVSVLAGRVGALRLTAALVVVISAVPRAGVKSSRASIGMAAGAVLLSAGLLGFVGASDVTVRWFGPAVAHGARTDPRVALTFDDGPDETYTLQVASILESYDVRGTFFEVGKAIDREPEIARALYTRGHLLANHSYQHDGWRWLDPRYPELERTQRAFEHQIGVCPTFYRPPHGDRTPFVSAVVGRHQMTTVLWDVTVGDWNASNAETLARRVLERVRPGSIVVLHDGLDGSPRADRSVLIAALPTILDGLRSKGLQPVRLDELLGIAGYGDHC